MSAERPRRVGEALRLLLFWRTAARRRTAVKLSDVPERGREHWELRRKILSEIIRKM